MISNNWTFTILSPLCLLKYKDRFKRNGFIYYFERYFESIDFKGKDYLDVINTQITFDEYMSQYPYQLNDVFEDLKNDVLSYHRQ